jgi:hypothetical protein
MVNNFNYASLLPKVSYRDFLLGIQNSLNFIFVFRKDGKVDIIDRNEILSGTAIDLNEYQVGTWRMGERRNVSFKFNPEYDKEDGRFSQYDDLSERYKDYKDPVETFNDLAAIASPAFGELRRVKDSGKIYEYKWKVVATEDQYGNGQQFDALGWEFVSTGPQPFVFGTGDTIEEINTAVSPIQDEPFVWVKFPVVNQKGNLLSMQSVWKYFTLRFLATHPLLLGSQAELRWEDAYGLFENRWRKWVQFLATSQPVECEFQFPLHVLTYVNENITSKFRTNEGEFIIEENDTEFGLNTIGKTTIKGYKV